MGNSAPLPGGGGGGGREDSKAVCVFSLTEGENGRLVVEGDLLLVISCLLLLFSSSLVLLRRGAQEAAKHQDGCRARVRLCSAAEAGRSVVQSPSALGLAAVLVCFRTIASRVCGLCRCDTGVDGRVTAKRRVVVFAETKDSVLANWALLWEGRGERDKLALAARLVMRGLRQHCVAQFSFCVEQRHQRNSRPVLVSFPSLTRVQLCWRVCCWEERDRCVPAEPTVRPETEKRDREIERERDRLREIDRDDYRDRLR
jgi:hypothetical protein